MDEYLTVKQIQELLKIDRITVYRMLNDGRLHGIKIGQQWRFTRHAVERLLSGVLPEDQTAPVEANPAFPTHCLQTIQDLFSAVSQISALMIDSSGQPVTKPSSPCSYCQLIQQSSSGQQACQASWQALASSAGRDGTHFTCHAGISYLSAPVIDEGLLAGHVLAGQFYWKPPVQAEQQERIRRLSEAHQLREDALMHAACAIPVIDSTLRPRVETWPPFAARAVQSILHERTGFIHRLNQIASLTQVS